MARFDVNKLSYRKQEILLNELCYSLSQLRYLPTMKQFIKDLLNRQERMMLTRRLLVAKMLIDGKSYKQIKEELNIGRATISRISRWVHFGRGGYQRAVVYVGREKPPLFAPELMKYARRKNDLD